MSDQADAEAAGGGSGAKPEPAPEAPSTLGGKCFLLYADVLALRRIYDEESIYRIHRAILLDDLKPTAQEYHAQLLRLLAVFAEVNLFGDATTQLGKAADSLPQAACEYALKGAAEFVFVVHGALLRVRKNQNIAPELARQLPTRPVERVERYNEQARTVADRLVSLGYKEVKLQAKPKKGLGRLFGG